MNAYDIAMKNKDYFKLLINAIPDIIFCKDMNLVYTVSNKACDEFYKSLGAESVVGKTDYELAPKEMADECVKNDMKVLNEKETQYSEEVMGEYGSDFYKVYHTIKTPIIDNDGNVIGLLGSARDITNQKEIEEKLRILSYKDQLTGMYNRTYFDETMQKILKEDVFNIGVVLTDINGLKIINDNLGHISGDEVIKIISSALKHEISNKGSVFRWGGDEFVTLIYNTDKNSCMEYINSVCEYFKGKTYNGYNIGVCQGYSIFNNEYNDIDKAITEADTHLYVRKNELKKIKG